MWRDSERCAFRFLFRFREFIEYSEFDMKVPQLLGVNGSVLSAPGEHAGQLCGADFADRRILVR